MILRTALDRLYLFSGTLSAVCIVLIFLVVCTQVLLNAIDAGIALIAGRPLGLLLPSYAEFAGFFLAAATFLALAHTFRAGGHIRVSLLLSQMPPNLRRVAEILNLILAAAISATIAWRAALLTNQSWTYGDASHGLVPIPIWIPQSTFFLGSAILTICIADCLLTSLFGTPFGQLRTNDGPSPAVEDGARG